MSDADANPLQALLPLLRQLREIKGVREARPGVFQFRGADFVRIHVQGDEAHADMRKPGGSGFDRYPLASAPQQRKFAEDARLRVRRLEDE
jgi:hypothetical protein